MRRSSAIPPAAACVFLLVGAPAFADSVTISIVGTNDLHGRFMTDEQGRGGLVVLGGYIANLREARAADGGGVLLLDAGDTFQGGIESNLSEGLVVVDSYNAMGYTALHGAAIRGANSIVQYLVDQGIRIDRKDKQGGTALTIAEMGAGDSTQRRQLHTAELLQKLMTSK